MNVALKAEQVIKSCKTLNQLRVAGRYIERSVIEVSFFEGQLLESRMNDKLLELSVKPSVSIYKYC